MYLSEALPSLAEKRALRQGGWTVLVPSHSHDEDDVLDVENGAAVTRPGATTSLQLVTDRPDHPLLLCVQRH